MHAACGGERDKEKLGITCPPDRVPQTPAGRLRPPAPPAQRLRSGEPCLGRRTASPAECLSSVSQFCANGEVTSSYQGLSNCRGNFLVQAGRPRRPKGVVHVFVFFGGGGAAAQHTQKSRK